MRTPLTRKGKIESGASDRATATAEDAREGETEETLTAHLRTAVIEISGVSKAYERANGRLEVLDDIHLRVAEEEILCVVGPSGCGKSTLLRAIAGLETVDRGTIVVRGHRVTGPGRDRAVVFQDDAVFPWFTVGRNVTYGLEAAGVPKAERELARREVLNLTRLSDFTDYYPRELSGGMKKRVDIARAYANDPDVLLMDEAFGGLDVMTKEQMQLDLSDIMTRRRKTVLFVTHDIEEAIFLGDRVAVMNSRPGRIVDEIPITIPRPRNRDTRLTPVFLELRRRIASQLADVPDAGDIQAGNL